MNAITVIVWLISSVCAGILALLIYKQPDDGQGK